MSRDNVLNTIRKSEIIPMTKDIICPTQFNRILEKSNIVSCNSLVGIYSKII